MFEAIIHGVILAFGLILPLGVQNIFVFSQGASQSSFLRAIPVIITAAICDTILILLAVLGVSFILLSLPRLKTIIFGGGIIFLIYMGWLIWKSEQAGESNKSKEGLSPKKQIMFAASVSLLNPHAILDTIGVIGTNSLSYSGDEKIAFTCATIVVSWLWFFGLAIVGRSVGRIDQTGNLLKVINKLSALIIWGVAVYMGVQLVAMLIM
ncbi:LysE/ArgO family amino acid transporter [Ferdinandcohnia quinoae]|uniref:LysE/ArgO family amino acid transporter n=1 Tax=Fredinandcohnia quinoae TaxID=2918902 RepID=A0AAW5E9Y0_9BACI|nr:LysE/ArgO family amino acid transporter [Fredinandcohnia sp. SECRCQ15]MCH1626470.1 LysE/ArgO family amino acid transporter [Fredinandcohnia sp. SECRCQ15]